MVEMYSKNKVDDRDYDPLEADIYDDKLAIYITQLRNLLSTEPGSVLGDVGVGIGLESLLYEYNVSTKNLKRMVLENIHNYATMSKHFKTDIDIKFAEGTKRDIVFMDILIDNVKSLELRIS